VLLNVPAVSAWEWHPVSISSSPSDAATTHHVKVGVLVVGFVGGDVRLKRVFL
jgi:hypothetical protein